MRSRGETSWRGDEPAGACGVGMKSSSFVKGVGAREDGLRCYVNACKELQRSSSLFGERDLPIDAKTRKQ
jgi:hypothetical protein